MSSRRHTIQYHEFNESLLPSIILDLTWDAVQEFKALYARYSESKGNAHVEELFLGTEARKAISLAALKRHPIDENRDFRFIHFIANLTPEQFKWLQDLKQIMKPEEYDNGMPGHLFTIGFDVKIPALVMFPVMVRALRRAGHKVANLSAIMDQAYCAIRLSDEAIILSLARKELKSK